MISRLIAGETSPWETFYDPSRVSVSAAKNFIAENITAVKNFAEYIAPGELNSVEELKPGKGAIIREGLHKIAAFRDDDGKLHRVSAACTHVGCHIHSEFFRTVLGLSMPWFAFRGGRHAAQCTCNLPAGANGFSIPGKRKKIVVPCRVEVSSHCRSRGSILRSTKAACGRQHQAASKLYRTSFITSFFEGFSSMIHRDCLLPEPHRPDQSGWEIHRLEAAAAHVIPAERLAKKHTAMAAPGTAKK